METRKLSNHKFYVRVRETRKKLDNIKFTIHLAPDPDYVMSNQEEYSYDVLNNLTLISKAYEQLEYIPVFVTQFLGGEILLKSGITHIKYLQYHMENHYLKISTLFDQCVSLTNEVFRLGVPTKDASIRQLRSNKYTKETQSIVLLKELEKRIGGIKAIRNRITHRGEFNDPRFRDVQNFITLIDTANQLYDENEINLTKENLETVQQEWSTQIATKMQDLIDKQLTQLEQNNQMIYNTIALLFDSLQSEFQIRLKQII
jgi:hypothetical protein